MPSSVNAKATRAIWSAVDQIVAGKLRQAVEDLCRLIRREPVPEVVNHHTLPTAPEAGRVQGAGDLVSRDRLRGERDSATISPQPQPRKRIVSKAAITAYVAAHPACEVLGCPRLPCPEPHHLVSRKMRGSDVESNLVRLCLLHHNEWHHCGGRTWLQRHATRLTAETRSKVQCALRVEEIGNTDARLA